MQGNKKQGNKKVREDFFPYNNLSPLTSLNSDAATYGFIARWAVCLFLTILTYVALANN